MDIISLKDRRVKEAHKEVDDERELIDYDVPVGDDLDLAIQQGIEEGSITLATLTKVVMDLCGSVDTHADIMKKLCKALRIEVDADKLEKANSPV